MPSQSNAPRYFVAYQDDGPKGPCGQSYATTKPWNRLYVFDHPKAMLDFIHDVGVETHRLCPRVTGFWAEGDEDYPSVTDWTGEDALALARRMRSETLDSYPPATLIEGA